MPTFKRTMQDLDGKIAQEQPKEAPKPIEPKQYNPAKEFKPKQEKPNPAKSWELYDNWSKFAFADQTPENIEKGNKAAEDFGAEFSKHLNPKQEEEFSTIFGTFKSPDEVTDYMEKIIGKKPEKETQKFEFGSDPTDPDLERGYGPAIKSVAYRGEDIAKAKEAGWSDDDIIDALLEQDYDEDEAIDFVTKYDPKRFKDPATNPARSYEAWEEARKAESAAQMDKVRKQFPKFVQDLTEIHANDEDKYFDEDAIRDNIYEMGVGELGEDEIEQLTKELSEAMQRSGFENKTVDAKYLLEKEEDFNPTEPQGNYLDGAKTHSENEFLLEAQNDRGMYNYITKNLDYLYRKANSDPQGAIEDIIRHGERDYGIDPKNIRKDYAMKVLEKFYEEGEKPDLSKPEEFKPTEQVYDYDDLYGAKTESERNLNVLTSNDQGAYDYIINNIDSLAKEAEYDPKSVINKIRLHFKTPGYYREVNPENIRKDYLIKVIKGFVED